jgi:hypothetical protein
MQLMQGLAKERSVKEAKTMKLLWRFCEEFGWVYLMVRQIDQKARYGTRYNGPMHEIYSDFGPTGPGLVFPI